MYIYPLFSKVTFYRHCKNQLKLQRQKIDYLLNTLNNYIIFIIYIKYFIVINFDINYAIFIIYRTNLNIISYNIIFI